MPTDSLSPDDYFKLIAGMGFECTHIDDPPGGFTFLAEGYKVAAFTQQSDKVLRLYCGFNDIKPSLEFVNQWNRGHILCRAFVAEDGTSRFCYELDLAGGGAAEANVQEFVKVFRNSIAEYAQLCLQAKAAKA